VCVCVTHCASSLRRALSGQTAARLIGKPTLLRPIDLAAVCPDKALHRELAQCILIAVTYNSFCLPFGQERDFSSLEHSPEFDFVSTLSQVVHEISHDSQHAVFLAVDELMKAADITGNVMPPAYLHWARSQQLAQVLCSSKLARPGGRGQHHRLLGK